MKAILLVAGYAKRLRPLTTNFPKALLTVGGKPMLDRVVEELLKLGCVDEIHVVSNHRFIGDFENWAAERPQWPLVLHDDGTTDEPTRLGAIGDLQFVIEKTGLEDDMVICAGDNLLDIDWADVYQTYQKHPDSPLLLVQKTNDLNMLRRFAVLSVDENGRVTSFEEKPEEPKSDLAAFALYWYPRSVVPMVKQYLDEGNPQDAPGNLAAWLYTRLPVYVYVTDRPCYDIGTIDSLNLVRGIYGE